MKITCQSCQSKYTVSDEKVQGKTVKIKCRKCGATILVNSGGVTTSGAGADADSMSAVGAAEGGAQPTFQVNVADGDQRSMTMQDIIAAYNTSVITADTYVWADGMGDWQPLGQVESIVAALNNPAAATATPAPAAYAPPAAAYAPPADAYTPPAAAYGPPAAAYGPPATSTPIPAYAAPEPAPEPVAEAPRAAARRDPARRAPDLFGGGMGAQSVEEVATSAPLYNGAAMARGAPVPQAGRDENSMLFSLSALTAKAATTAAASSSSKTTATKEDSGVIDLKALANSAGAPAQSSGASDFMSDHGALFPLGAPIAAPAAAPMSIPLPPPPAPSKTPIFIGIGVAVASLAIVGAFFAMKGTDKPPPVETVAMPTPPPPPTVEAAPPPTATAEVSAAPSASAVAKKGGPRYTGGGGTKAGAGAATTAAGGTTAAPTTKPKSSGCGCAATDLMCAMKCSAK